jgi:hypothetical protein
MLVSVFGLLFTSFWQLRVRAIEGPSAERDNHHKCTMLVFVAATTTWFAHRFPHGIGSDHFKASIYVCMNRCR